VLVAQEPSREPIGRVEVGKDDVFETFAHRRCRSRPTGFVTHETFLVYPDLQALLLAFSVCRVENAADTDTTRTGFVRRSYRAQ
jgi:hypothetical protein